MSSSAVSLRSRVNAAVAPYYTSSNTTKPPFTIAEIMIMAWVCRRWKNSPYVSDEEVSDWMFTTFGYYRKMALKEVYEHSFLKCATTFKHRNALYDIASQRTIQCERMDVPLEVRPSHKMGGYTSTLAGAQRFLHRALGGELSQFDGFFKLPAEIRGLIYEELFRCHVDELQYNDSEFQPLETSRGLRLSQRGKRSCWSIYEDWTRTAVPDAHHWTASRQNDPSATEPTSQLMAMLLVNRQIFAEAMPVFYNVNHFHATSLLELTHMLKYCGARRRPHFTSISVSYAQDVGPRTAIKAFKLLKDAKRLRRLEIEATEDSSLDSNAVPQLPGIKILGSVRVKELQFTGSCSLIEAYLRPIMVEARDESRGGKRKARGKGKSRKSAKTGENADAA